MNLVAKEFVAAQDPEDPGVLVLSRFAGAAEQLKEALLVNPYDIEGTAGAIQLALQMPLEERRAAPPGADGDASARYDVHWWCDSFLDALGRGAGRGNRHALAAAVTPATFLRIQRCAPLRIGWRGPAIPPAPSPRQEIPHATSSDRGVCRFPSCRRRRSLSPRATAAACPST